MQHDFMQHDSSTHPIQRPSQTSQIRRRCSKNNNKQTKIQIIQQDKSTKFRFSVSCFLLTEKIQH
jgi:hypothetical protein